MSNTGLSPDWSLTRLSSDPAQYVGKDAMGQKIKELTDALGQAKTLVGHLRGNEEVFMAQSVLMDMTLVKMNQTVHAQEEEQAAKKKKDSNVVAPAIKKQLRSLVLCNFSIKQIRND
ncbi:hypothetical protein AAF712_014980 [Marasmius tenuissimus]|uniref:Uncharacterized protein n=1 Tax=Marasmius tenuissimus TaxID=585030 RepID=A0ABR2Z9T0_9AGAR